MLKETGRVVAVEKDGLWVETLKQSACGACAARHGCGQKLLMTPSKSSNITFIKALFEDQSSQQDWAVGDNAILGVSENALVWAALIAYGIPLLFLVIGAYGGTKLGSASSQELMSVVGAICGLLIGGLSVRIHQCFSQKKSFYQAYVVGKTLVTDA